MSIENLISFQITPALLNLQEGNIEIKKRAESDFTQILLLSGTP